ncbi:Maf family protein, partial [Pseudomonas aeruginosa]|uniref:Maf family protein n=1 Tax=Pseudomonas aeruginosa TaxID=287 RepID=UPI00396850FC
MPDLILASSSPYRRELLTRLRLPFESASPDIDESHRPGESAEELVRRLSASKAEALAGRYPQHLVIGSDQVAVLDGDILGKSHTPARANQQLRNASAKSVTFL